MTKSNCMELYFMGLGVGATLTGIVESCGISSAVLAYMLPALTVLVTVVLGLSRGMVQKMFPEQAPEVKVISRASRRATISSKRRKLRKRTLGSEEFVCDTMCTC